MVGAAPAVARGVLPPGIPALPAALTRRPACCKRRRLFQAVLAERLQAAIDAEEAGGGGRGAKYVDDKPEGEDADVGGGAQAEELGPASVALREQLGTHLAAIAAAEVADTKLDLDTCRRRGAHTKLSYPNSGGCRNNCSSAAVSAVAEKQTVLGVPENAWWLNWTGPAQPETAFDPRRVRRTDWKFGDDPFSSDTTAGTAEFHYSGCETCGHCPFCAPVYPLTLALQQAKSAADEGTFTVTTNAPGESSVVQIGLFVRMLGRREPGACVARPIRGRGGQGPPPFAQHRKASVQFLQFPPVLLASDCI